MLPEQNQNRDELDLNFAKNVCGAQHLCRTQYRLRQPVFHGMPQAELSGWIGST